MPHSANRLTVANQGLKGAVAPLTGQPTAQVGVAGCIRFNSRSVSFGRARLPYRIATNLLTLPRGQRGRMIALILRAHLAGLDIAKLVESTDELRRLGVLLNQSLRLSGRASEIDIDRGLKLLNSLFL